MDRSIPLLLIGLVFGGGIGFLVAASNGVTLDGHDHDTDHSAAAPSEGGAHDHSMHDHSAMQEVTGAVPTLNIEILPDSAAGWNLHLMVSNFQFAADHAGQGAVDGEGHAHLHVNGTKTARIYGDWYHIETLPKGSASIEVGLYSNDHKGLSVDGQPIKQTLVIENN